MTFIIRNDPKYNKAVMNIACEVLRTTQKLTLPAFCKWEIEIIRRMLANYFNGKFHLAGLEFLHENYFKKDVLVATYEFYRFIYDISNTHWLKVKPALNSVLVTDRPFQFEQPGEVLPVLLILTYKNWKLSTKKELRTAYRYWNASVETWNTGESTEKYEKTFDLMLKLPGSLEITLEPGILEVIRSVLPNSANREMEKKYQSVVHKKMQYVRSLI